MKKYNLLIAYLIALVAVLASLAAGEIRDVLPCTLCWYQRIIAFPLAMMLGIAAYHNDRAIVRYALPLTFIGAVVAFYHFLLPFFPALERALPCHVQESCKPEVGSFAHWIPFLSFMDFVLIALLLLPVRSSAQSDT